MYFHQPVINYLNSIKYPANGKSPYSARYIGSMVADVHRILLKGGVFLYPPTKKAPSGKLRLMYEANPVGFIIELEPGFSTTSLGARDGADHKTFHRRAKEVIDYTVRHEFTNADFFYGLSINARNDTDVAKLLELPQVQEWRTGNRQSHHRRWVPSPAYSIRC